MKVYVSCASDRADLANAVMQRLQDEGHEVVFDWTIDIANEDSMDSEELAERAQKGIDSVIASDVLLLLVTKDMRSRGSMIEVGVALGTNTPVIVAELEEGFDHFFSYHPKVWRAHSVLGALKQFHAMEKPP